MTAASATSSQAKSAGHSLSRLARLSASHPLWAAFVLTVVATALRLHDTVDSDVAWQLWIAHHIHAGANLYTDIVEVNPPLWFWMALPIDRVATLLHLRAESVLIVSLGAVTALAATATNLLTGHIPAQRRTLFLAYAALTLMAMPWMHVGQREQIILIGTLPYAALLAARRKATAVQPSLASAIGVGFALGVGLKHYFIVVPALLELWLISGTRRGWRPVRPETAAIVGVGLAYAAAVLLLEPDFIRKTIPMVQLAYGVTGALGVRFLLGPYAITALFTAGVALAHGRLLSKGAAPLSSVLLAGAFAFTIVYFIQSKGWLYQAIPMLGFGSLALVALLAEIAAAPVVLRVVSPALLAFPFLLAAEDRAYSALPNPDLIRAVDQVRPGETIGFLAVEPAIPWSITLQRSFRYPSRYMGYWMMRAIVGNELRGGTDPRLTALGKQVVSETVSDFLCTPPQRIIVAGKRWQPQNFDILAFFKRDPKFAELFSHYRLRSSTSLDMYELASRLPPPSGPCRHGV
jgi:hypothetical protein